MSGQVAVTGEPAVTKLNGRLELVTPPGRPGSGETAGFDRVTTLPEMLTIDVFGGKNPVVVKVNGKRLPLKSWQSWGWLMVTPGAAVTPLSTKPELL